MSDVFVSYARLDEQRARSVAEALVRAGYSVWRDDELPAHRPYSEVIEERLGSAKAVVALWSAEATKSQWVRSEANAGRAAKKLVQGTLDGGLPPMPFDQIQCADLRDWNGTSETPGWRKLIASVSALAGSDAHSTKEIGRHTGGKASICVLPFLNMSGDAEQEYFSDGISEDITTDLSKVSALRVIARNTSFQFKGRAVDVCEIASRLGVTHVLEGSVRKARERVRITAQLIDGRTGEHVWAERYDRDLMDIFAVQDDLSASIVEALRVRLLAAEKVAIESRGTTSVEAYNLYLMARQVWIDGEFGRFGREHRVIRICRRAIAIDPNYAEVWALLGLAQANLHYAEAVQKDEDDGLAAANRALALNPQIAEARLPRAWHLAMVGREEDAQSEIDDAIRTNPDSWEVNKEAARMYYRQGRFEGAARHLEIATKIAEHDFHSRGMLVAAYLAQGDRERARKCATRLLEPVESALARDPGNGAALAYGALSFAAAGDRQRAREWIDRALLLDPDNVYMRYNLAWSVLAFFADKEEAIGLLEPSMRAAGKNLVSLAEADPNLNPLREDPRFERLMASAKARFVLAIDRARGCNATAPRD